MTINRNEVEVFFQNLTFQASAALETQRQLDRYLASGVNLLELFGVRENQFSNLLAQMLNPKGGHGQGTLFLELFLKGIQQNQPEQHSAMLGQVFSRLEQVKVSTEHGTDQQRRIDLLLDFGNFGVGIENKPWAGDQPHQLSHYSHYLNGIYQGRYLLVYLSGDGRPPDSSSIREAKREELTQAGEFVMLGYRPFLTDWAAEAAIRCQAEKVRWLLRDTVDWLERYFSQAPQAQLAEVTNGR